MTRVSTLPRTAMRNSAATSHQRWTNRLVPGENRYDGVDDQLADVEQCNGLQRGKQAEDKAQRHHKGARAPHDREHGRQIAQGRHALLPRVFEVLLPLSHSSRAI